MKREQIPQENIFLNLFQHFPHNGRSSLPHHWTQRGAIYIHPPSLGMDGKPKIVSQCQASTSTATMAQVPTKPYGINFSLARRLQNIKK